MNDIKNTHFPVTDDDPLISKELLLKYLHYWPWFFITVLISLFFGFIYMRYSPTVYASVAKIKIIDETKELDLGSDALSPFAMYSSVNLDNEIEILTSYRLLAQVVDELDLDISYYDDGIFKTNEIWSPPFVISKNIQKDSISTPRSFNVKFDDAGFAIETEDGLEFEVDYDIPNSPIIGLPVNITVRPGIDTEKYKGTDFKVVLWPKEEAVLSLSKALFVEPTRRKGEILSLWLWGESSERSEDILNVIIDKFNKDGVLDRQLVAKRTLGFIDDRFVNLSGQLDSIEIGKQDFKQVNDLSYIDEDVTFTLRKKSLAEDEVASLQTQLTLSRLLRKSIVGEAAYSLLPSDIGLENSSINSLVSGYNDLVLRRSKLLISVGENHPSLVALSSQLDQGRQNILRTVDVYQKQVGSSLGQYNQVMDQAGNAFARLPEKEKMLRAIERQQDIKEKLFVLLLQKREEAAINYAVTAPSIKVIDYGQTNKDPDSPKKIFVYPLSLFMGLALPFLILFIRFSSDSRIRERSEILKSNPEIPILGEIPYHTDETNFLDASGRSMLVESYRILGTNLDYQLSNNNLDVGKVIFVTSAVNGEGKTLTSFNLSLAYSSLGKTVLLVGCDLRMPQLGQYFNVDESTVGVSDFLEDETISWERCIHKSKGTDKFHEVCFSGKIPTNPPQLLAGKRFGAFIDWAKNKYDYVIVDTAPTLLVTDTMLISKYADLTLFVLRIGFTEKRLLEYSKNLNKSGRLPNMTYVINSVGEGLDKNYNYGYGYGYNEKSRELLSLKDFIIEIKTKGMLNAVPKQFEAFKKLIKSKYFKIPHH